MVVTVVVVLLMVVVVVVVLMVVMMVVVMVVVVVLVMVVVVVVVVLQYHIGLHSWELHFLTSSIISCFIKKETKTVSKISTASILTGQVASYSKICLVSTLLCEFVKYEEWLSDLFYYHHGGGHD